MQKKGNGHSDLEKLNNKLHHEAKEQIHAACVALADVTIEETALAPALFPIEQQKAQMEANLVKELTQFQKKIEDGALQLLTTLTELAMHEPEFTSYEVASDLARLVAFSSALKQNQLAYFEELAKGKCLQEICTITDATMQKLYKAAVHLYAEKHYKQAADAFAFLSFLNPNVSLFWRGLGNAQYHLHHYEAALYALAYAALQDPHDPYCHLISCRCYEAIKEYDNAVNALDLSLHCIQGNPSHAKLKPEVEKEKVRLSHKL